MKALVYTGKLSLIYRDETPPVPLPGESLVRIDAAGICGSDMHAYHGHDPRRVPPLILGHELAGIVLEGELAGQRVAINPLLSCKHCRHCLAGNANLCQSRDLVGLGRPGGFAQYVSVDSGNLFPLDEHVDMAHASLMEPAAVSLHAIMLAERVLSRPISECRVLIIGGGAIGVLAALILKGKGVSELVIAETNAPRRQTLQQLDCGEVYDPLGEQQPADNHFDLVIDAVGSGRTREAASRQVTAGGVISHIGLQDNEPGLDTRRLTLQEITFIGNYIYNPIDLHAALALIGSGGLGKLGWLESRPLSEGAGAFRDILAGSTSSPKIILHPDHG